MAKMTRINLYITERQLSQLTKLSEQTGAPLAELVRRSIDLYLERQQSKK